MSEIEKYYNGEIHVDFEEIPIERKSWEELSQEIIEQHNEIERLKSIIKEVREHIEKTIEYEKSCGFNRWTYEDGQETYIDMVEKTLEILDEENKNGER